MKKPQFGTPDFIANFGFFRLNDDDNLNIIMVLGHHMNRLSALLSYLCVSAPSLIFQLASLVLYSSIERRWRNYGKQNTKHG